MQIEEYCNSRKLPAEYAAQLAKYPRAQVELLLGSLEPSANSLKSLLQLVDEIAKRDSCSTEEVFANAELQSVLSLDELPRKERGKRYREVLEAVRYPELVRIKEHLLAQCKQLASDCNVRIELPKDLEGDSLQVSFSVRSPEEFAKYAERLAAAASHTATEEIFATLCGEYE